MKDVRSCAKIIKQQHTMSRDDGQPDNIRRDQAISGNIRQYKAITANIGRPEKTSSVIDTAPGFQQ